MAQTIEAIYDGIVFRPDKPVKIKPNTRVRIIVKVEEKSNETVANVAGHLFGVYDAEAPSDLSANKKHLEGFGE